MNYEDILLDIQKCNETIRNITDHSPTLFRTPSGSYDKKTISAAKISAWQQSNGMQNHYQQFKMTVLRLQTKY